jgi:hypothetical protein
MSPSNPEPMDVEEVPQQPLNNNPDEGTMTQSPFGAHVNTGVFSGHPGLQAFLTLGVPINAPLSQIKSAYRNLARAYHPDRVNAEDQQEANEKFSRISAAYNLLTHAYSQYDGRMNGGNENYPVFFGTPDSLESHQPKERDPYELFRNSKNDSSLPHRAPEHCIIPGDSSSLFQSVWPQEAQKQVPLSLPYEAQPPPLPQVDADGRMEVESVPNMKRVMDDDMQQPRQKRQRMVGPVSFGGHAENGNGTFPPTTSTPTFGKRDAPVGGMMKTDGPAAKKRRTA